MKKRISIILFVLAFPLLSIAGNTKEEDSTSKKSVYKFELVKTVNLPLKEPITLTRDIFQYAKIDDIETLIYYLPYSKIVFYDINAKKQYNEISLKGHPRLELGSNGLDNFKYISKDSIFLLYRKFNKNELLDSTQLIQVNMEGEVKKYYSLKNKHVRTKGNRIKKKYAISPALYGSKMEIVNNNIFLFMKNTDLEIGTKEFVEKRLPCAANYNLMTQKLATSENLCYPDINYQTYYSSFFTTSFYCLSKNRLPLIRFFYSPKLFEWDYNSDEVKEYTLKSSFIDTIPPLAKGQDFYSFPNAMYKEIYYDQYRKLYYSYLGLLDLKFSRGWSMIIADENLNYLGEIYNPTNMLGLDLIFTEDFIIGIEEDYLPDENGEEKYNIILKYCKLVKTDEDFEQYIKNIKEENL